MLKSRRHTQSKQGMTLIEVMLSIFIGSIIMSGFLAGMRYSQKSAVQIRELSDYHTLLTMVLSNLTSRGCEPFILPPPLANNITLDTRLGAENNFDFLLFPYVYPPSPTPPPVPSPASFLLKADGSTQIRGYPYTLTFKVVNDDCNSDPNRACFGTLSLVMKRRQASPGPTPSSQNQSFGQDQLSSAVAYLKIRVSGNKLSSCRAMINNAGQYPTLNNRFCLWPGQTYWGYTQNGRGKEGDRLQCPQGFVAAGACLSGMNLTALGPPALYTPTYCDTGKTVATLGCCQLQPFELEPGSTPTWHPSPTCPAGEVMTGICGIDPYPGGSGATTNPNPPKNAAACGGKFIQCSKIQNFSSILGVGAGEANFCSDRAFQSGSFSNCNMNEALSGACQQGTLGCGGQISCCYVFP